MVDSNQTIFMRLVGVTDLQHLGFRLRPGRR